MSNHNFTDRMGAILTTNDPRTETWWVVACTFKNSRVMQRVGYLGAAIQNRIPANVQMRLARTSNGVEVLVNSQAVAQDVHDHRTDVLDAAQIKRRFVGMAQPVLKCNHIPRQEVVRDVVRFRCASCGTFLSQSAWA